jgi:hypothetical protein
MENEISGSLKKSATPIMEIMNMERAIVKALFSCFNNTFITTSIKSKKREIVNESRNKMLALYQYD